MGTLDETESSHQHYLHNEWAYEGLRCFNCGWCWQEATHPITWILHRSLTIKSDRGATTMNMTDDQRASGDCRCTMWPSFLSVSPNIMWDWTDLGGSCQVIGAYRQTTPRWLFYLNLYLNFISIWDKKWEDKCLNWMFPVSHRCLWRVFNIQENCCLCSVMTVTAVITPWVTDENQVFT